MGRMSAAWTRLRAEQGRTLIAAGAAAGLAAIVNAPLAAIVFVTEELREHFEYGFAPIQSVILACVLAAVVSGWALGQGPALPVPHLGVAPLAALPLFLLLALRLLTTAGTLGLGLPGGVLVPLLALGSIVGRPSTA